jgi:hypothetical protein
MWDGAGIALAAGLAYLVLHFLLYAAELRWRPPFQTERGIFVYHLVSALLFVTAAFAALAVHRSDAAVAVAIGLIAAHGIYSISFLEIWSLTQGSYSVAVISGVAAGANLSRGATIEVYARIGDAKKGDRLSMLSKLSLVRRVGDCWQLLPRGRFLAKLFRAVLWLADVQRAG